MNDAWKELQDKLEQATARGELHEAELDPETASLHETWIALERLLESAVPQERPLSIPCPTSLQRQPRRWLLGSVAVVAASLLIGAVAIWIWQSGSDDGRPGPGPQQITEGSHQHPAQLPQGGLPTKPPADELKWDDGIDDQLAEMGQQVILASEDWTSQAVASAVIQREFEQVKKGLTEENPY
jgi:hypothetical protein